MLAVTSFCLRRLFPLNFSFLLHFSKAYDPCSPGQRAPRPDHLAPKPLPKLAPGSLADLVFSLQTYNDILSCLYTSKEIHVNLQDPMVSV